MRQTECGCGAVVTSGSRGPLRTLCDGCRREKRLADKRRHQSDYLIRINGSTRTCRDCGVVFTVGTQPNTCGRCHSLRVNPSGTQRGPIVKSYAALRRRLIDEADECALCGETLNKVAHFTDPLAPNIDHIVQRCDGGSNDAENLRVVHRQCNDAWSKTVPKYRLGASRGALLLRDLGL